MSKEEGKLCSSSEASAAKMTCSEQHNAQGNGQESNKFKMEKGRVNMSEDPPCDNVGSRNDLVSFQASSTSEEKGLASYLVTWSDDFNANTLNQSHKTNRASISIKGLIKGLIKG